jgi:hypothetical protein
MMTSLQANDVLAQPHEHEPDLVVSEMIGVGGDREVWRHPGNPSLCIKVPRPDVVRAQNDIDLHYSQWLAQRNIASPHLTQVYGWVETNRGRGLVVELAQQPDGTPCPTLSSALLSGMITQEQGAALVDEAFDWLIAQGVIMADCGLSNFLVRLSPQGRYHLVIVDGLGARHFGFKYSLRRTFVFLARRKDRMFRKKVMDFLMDRSSKLWVPKKHTYVIK